MASSSAQLPAPPMASSSVQFPAPAGWTKKLMPKKRGTSKVKEVIFIAPTGEEMRNRSQLIKYLKSHPGGPEVDEFYWGTSEAPRRSLRISEKPKVATESEPTNKRRKLVGPKKDDEEEDNEEVDLEKEVYMDNTETTEKEKEVVTEDSEDAESSTEVELDAPQVDRVRVEVKVRIEAKSIQKQWLK